MITVSTEIKSSVPALWKFWTEPAHIINWNFASSDWHCPKAENDLRVSGKFNYTMAARDGSVEFEFKGSYLTVIENSRIEYLIEDGRKVYVSFEQNGDISVLTEEFEPEDVHSAELQRQGWQSILDQFKIYVERQTSIKKN